MSADNYLLVSESNFKVMGMCASTGTGIVYYKGKSLEDAKQWAYKEDESGMIEYGVHFTKDKIGNGYNHKEMLEEKKADMKTMENLVSKLAKQRKRVDDGII